MKRYLLIGLMLAETIPTFGQGRDTVFAVHKLFRQKRGSANSSMVVSDSTKSKAYQAQRAGSPLTKQEVRQNALGNTAFYVAGTLQANRYSADNEAYIIRRYQEGGPIPPDIRRKLKRKHFHRTTRDVLNP